jgi:hypothetical protein
MRHEIAPSVEWKLDRAVEAMIGGGEPSGHSFDERVETFVDRWEERVLSGGSGWADSAVEPEDRPGGDDPDASEGQSDLAVPEFGEGSRPREIDPAVARRVEAIAVAENPQVPVGRLSFNDTLLAALEAWNSYATGGNAGWIPADPRFGGRT